MCVTLWHMSINLRNQTLLKMQKSIESLLPDTFGSNAVSAERMTIYVLTAAAFCQMAALAAAVCAAK